MAARLDFLKTGLHQYRYELALLALAAVLFASGVLVGGQRGNDEVRYTQIAQELFERTQSWKDLFLLQYRGEAYTQKPPLYFWLSALANFFVPGSTLIAARLVSLLSSLGTLFLVVLLGRSLFERKVGLLAAALLLTIPQFFIYACSARLDALLTFFVTLAFLSFWRIDRNLGTLWKNQVMFHAAMGLAMLTKGPVGLLLPWLSILGYLAREGRITSFRRLIPVWSFALSVLPILLWAGLAIALAPHSHDFFHASIVDNLYGRFAQGTSHAKPFFYYLHAFPKSFLPWTLLWPILGIMAHREIFSATAATTNRRRAWNFLLSWVLISLAFFSICSGKRASYLLPLFPAASLLCADALMAWLMQIKAPERTVKQFGFALSLICGIAGTLFLLQPEIVSGKTALQAALHSLGFGLLILGIGLLVAQHFVRETQNVPERSIAVLLVIFASLELLSAIFLLPHYKTKIRHDEARIPRMERGESNSTNPISPDLYTKEGSS